MRQKCASGRAPTPEHCSLPLLQPSQPSQAGVPGSASARDWLPSSILQGGGWVLVTPPNVRDGRFHQFLPIHPIPPPATRPLFSFGCTGAPT